MSEREQELAPCPFCGGKAVAHIYPTDSAIHCGKCRVTVYRMFNGNQPAITMQQVIRAWNRRPQEGKP